MFTLAILLEAAAVWFDNATGTGFFQFDNEHDPTVTVFWPQLLSRAQHLVLPTACLVLGETAVLSRHQRSTMPDVLESDFLQMSGGPIHDDQAYATTAEAGESRCDPPGSASD